jgi:hypothetical protein
MRVTMLVVFSLLILLATGGVFELVLIFEEVRAEATRAGAATYYREPPDPGGVRPLRPVSPVRAMGH